MPDELNKLIQHYQEKAPFPDEQIQRAEKRTWLAEKLPKYGIGAEIGVFRGHFSEVLAFTAKPKTFYMIDPWTRCGETFGWGGAYTNANTLKTADAMAESRLRAMRGGVSHPILVEGFFPACSKQILHQLDWAYLDSSHTYHHTIKELDELERVVNPKGCIAGDDWRPNESHRHHGVFRAIQEFTARTPWKIVMCGYLGQWMLRRY